MFRNMLIFGLFTVLLLSLPVAGQTTWDAVRLRSMEAGWDARLMAMGGNGVATANNVSALYWNPAGLAQARRTSLAAEFSHFGLQNSSAFSGNLSEMENTFTRFRAFGMAFPIPTARGSLVFGFAYQFVKDLDDYTYFEGFNTNSNGLAFELEDQNGAFDWHPFDRNVLQREEISSNGGLHNWSFGGAVALSPNFDVGLTLNFWGGKEEYLFHFYQEDVDDYYNQYPADYFSYRLNRQLNTRLKGFNLKLGGMFKINPALRVGVGVETPTYLDITEEYSSRDELVFDDGYSDPYESTPGEWHYRVKTPYRFDAGVALLSRVATLTGAVRFTDWTQTRFEKPGDAWMDDDYADLLAENQYFDKEFRTTMNYHLGGELYLGKSQVILRGGYAYYPSPLKNADKELDREIYGGGIGFKAGQNVMLNFTYLKGKWDRFSEDDLTPGGTLEQLSAQKVFIGLEYSF